MRKEHTLMTKAIRNILIVIIPLVLVGVFVLQPNTSASNISKDDATIANNPSSEGECSECQSAHDSDKAIELILTGTPILNKNVKLGIR